MRYEEAFGEVYGEEGCLYDSVGGVPGVVTRLRFVYAVVFGCTASGAAGVFAGAGTVCGGAV